MTTRAALLRRLPGEGFVPPEADAPWSAATHGVAFAADVEAFAVEFWALAPAERAARYARLRAEAVGPTAARLGELEAGLGLTVVPFRDPKAAEVARAVREWFIQPPRERTALRTAWLRDRDRQPGWADAVRAVAAADPGLAAADPWVFDRVALRLWPTDAAPLRPPGWDTHDANPYFSGRSHRLARRVLVASVALLVLLAGVAVWRVETADPSPGPRTRFTVQEVRVFLAYRERLDRGADGFPARAPSGYYDWVRAGRPLGVP